jgi:hypothetical protein
MNCIEGTQWKLWQWFNTLGLFLIRSACPSMSVRFIINLLFFVSLTHWHTLTNAKRWVSPDLWPWKIMAEKFKSFIYRATDENETLFQHCFNTIFTLHLNFERRESVTKVLILDGVICNEIVHYLCRIFYVVIYNRRQILAHSIEPIWVGSTGIRKQNPVSETSCFK